MPAKDKRTVITNVGHITLPKVYRDYNGIQKGDRIEILYDGVLVVRPQNVKLNAKKQQALRELLEG